MSSEVHKYTGKILKKNENHFNAEVLNFPNNTKVNDAKTLEIKIDNFWKISDKSNNDQLKAVIGICFMLGSLTVMGIYSYFS